jgi:hypothetical protein
VDLTEIDLADIARLDGGIKRAMERVDTTWETLTEEGLANIDGQSPVWRDRWRQHDQSLLDLDVAYRTRDEWWIQRAVPPGRGTTV